MLLCNFCSGSPKVAIVACETCSYYYCSACLKKYHPKVGPLKTHNIIKASALSTEKTYCSRHEGEKNSIFCDICEVTVCLRCVPDHASHRLLKFDQAYEKCKDHFQQIQTKIEEELTQASKIKKATQTHIIKIQADGKAAEKKIREELNFIRSTINGCEKTMLVRIEDQVRNSCDMLQRACDEIPRFEQDAMKSLSTISDLVDQNSMISLLSNFGGVNEKTLKLLKTIHFLSKPCDVQLNFDTEHFDCTKEVQMIAKKLSVPDHEPPVQEIVPSLSESNLCDHPQTPSFTIEASDSKYVTAVSTRSTCDFLYQRLPDPASKGKSCDLFPKQQIKPPEISAAKVSASSAFIDTVISKHPEYMPSPRNSKNFKEQKQVASNPQEPGTAAGDLDVKDVKVNGEFPPYAHGEARPLDVGQTAHSEKNILSGQHGRNTSPLRFFTVDDSIPATSVGVKQRAMASYYGRYKLISEREKALVKNK